MGTLVSIDGDRQKTIGMLEALLLDVQTGMVQSVAIATVEIAKGGEETAANCWCGETGASTWKLLGAVQLLSARMSTYLDHASMTAEEIDDDAP